MTRIDAHRLNLLRTLWAFVNRCIIGKQLRWQRHHHFAVVIELDVWVLRYFANHRAINAPMPSNRHHRLTILWRAHQEHTFLAFAQQHVVGAHVGFTLRHFFQIDAHAHTPLGTHFGNAASEASGTHVLNAYH